ncbi:MAG TPA: ABC transporter permease [Candidatus Aminicenantes bacterium]|nr:ABC transporter permease [Candidatus Aminicenantes bacterium]HEB36988.1 ABC transporter permease [Candidatus Aminicenantes bacterium]
MIIPKLALRNLLGAGLRTWLNVVVLSLSFVLIIWLQGLYIGMGDQIKEAQIDVDYGGGQYWHESYDPYDPLTLEDAHGAVPDPIQNKIDKGEATPILIAQATIYPEGRLQVILLKGIDPAQTVVNFPSQFLVQENGEIPALIGTRMAKSAGLKIGDKVIVRWRDAQGTFDARDVYIAQIMKTIVPAVDQSQIWIPLETMRELMGMQNEASLVVMAKDIEELPVVSGWNFKSLKFLLADVEYLIKTKKTGGSIIYMFLLLLAMLAIFNTQVLSIFRRKKEMGSMMAMGFTRGKIIQLFTLEGAFHSVLAGIVAAIYGIPFLVWFAKKGWAMPEGYDDFGIALGEKLFPIYTAGLVFGTVMLILIVTTIVSFLPTRKIAKLKPTDALRGRLS